MGAETVVNKIREKSAAEAAAVREAANRKAAEIKANIINEARARAGEIIASANAKAELEVRRANQQARLEKRISALGYKHELIGEVKNDTEKVLAALNGDSWTKLYTKLVTANPITGKVTIAAAKADADKLTDSVLKNWSRLVTEATGTETEFVLSGENADIDGGIILCGDKYDLDLSYESVIAEKFETYEKAIADRLFA